MLWPKKIHTRNLLTKKIPTAPKFPTPSPNNFSNGPSLITYDVTRHALSRDWPVFRPWFRNSLHVIINTGMSWA